MSRGISHLCMVVFSIGKKAVLHSWRAKAAEPGAPKVDAFNACHLRPQSHGALEREGGGWRAPSVRASRIHIRQCAMEASAPPARRRTTMTG